MYQSTDVAERIRSVAKAKGISLMQLIKDAGLGTNTLSNFRTSMPKADNLAKIADGLQCSIDYLLGRTEYPEINNSPSSLPESEERLLHDIRRLDDEGKMMVSAAVIRETRRMQKGESWLLDEPDDSDAE